MAGWRRCGITKRHKLLILERLPTRHTGRLAGDDERERKNEMTIEVTFVDSGRVAREKPDPAFPNGKPVNCATNALVKTCTRNLPYPAPRVGSYLIRCLRCDWRGVISVAGRPDDPNMVTIQCKAGGLDG